MIARTAELHGRIFGTLQSWTEDWLIGLAARFVFAAVLLVYYLNSAATKVGEGLFGFLSVADNAYFQILPSVVEAYDYDASQVPLLPYARANAPNEYVALISRALGAHGPAGPGGASS